MYTKDYEVYWLLGTVFPQVNIAQVHNATHTADCPSSLLGNTEDYPQLFDLAGNELNTIYLK